MADKRFIELMPGARLTHGELLPTPATLKARVTQVVARDTYRRPERETIDSPEPIRESYDAP